MDPSALGDDVPSAVSAAPESGTEDLHPRISQQTLEQISTTTNNGLETCCVICLGGITDRCEAQPCQHNHFDYLCLITWLQKRATCPLCKCNVYEVRYDISENSIQEKIYKVPESCKRADRANARRAEDRSRSASPSIPENFNSNEDEAIRRRRLIYRHNFYSLHVGSNGRQHAASAYRELSLERFRRDSHLLSRARTWLHRELRVFQFLNTSIDDSQYGQSARWRGTSKMEYLLEYIMVILKHIDFQCAAGQMEDIIHEFLGRKFARLFLHELKAWLRSPHETLEAGDYSTQYKDFGILPNISRNPARNLGTDSSTVLKYNEPADAQKSPTEEAWQLYTFKKDGIADTTDIWERSVWLLGRDERVVDLITPHPSCSGQHAVLQFRNSVKRDNRKNAGSGLVENKDKRDVGLYVMDLNSVNGTFLNGEGIQSNHYIKVRHKDILKFGGSKREYVVILPPT